MKYVYGKKLRSFKKTAISFVASAVLLLNSLSVALPLLLAQRAAAAPSTSYSSVDLTTGWVTDRTTPSGGYNTATYEGRTALQMNIDASDASANNWYKYEGLKKNIGTADTIKADVFIESSWSSMDVSTGLWGVVRNADDDIAAYPIVAYSAPAGGWRVYDINLGTWITNSATVNLNAWNSLELAINHDDSSKMDVYINNTLASTQVATTSLEYFSEIIINSYNYGTSDYQVNWSNVAIGTEIPDPVLNAENFNTVDGNYRGISVGFNAKDFGTVTSVTVDMTRADGSHVIKTGNSGVLDIISGATTPQQLTAPFVIEEGTFTEASDTFYWDPAPATWTAATAPVSVLISVTDENGTVTVENNNFNQSLPSWPTYESLLPAPSSTVTVLGNTSSGENQPGWLFNRDTSTSTAYEFTTDESSIGNGSIYVAPIGSNPSDKFIAELFEKTPVEELNSFAYDFKIAGSGMAADADDFYLNVYANITNDNKYYDCRFDYAPATGSSSAFTTAKFFSSSAPAHVQQSGSARTTCPATLAEMPSGSYVRAFAVNVGQSVASDMGLGGYLDKVVLNTDSAATIYDFEYSPDPTNNHQLNISGDVYRDIALDNCDNLNECKNQRTNEILEGWEMRLYKEDGVWQLIDTDTTDSNGIYKFATQHSAGTYHVCEVVKAGWTQPIQTWSGSGYKVDTANLSGDTTEGPYCTTTNYDDTGDRSSKSHFGNVDTHKPTGIATYSGGTDVSGIRYLSNINDFSFTAEFTDNYLLGQSSFVVWRVNSEFTNRTLVCGNWFNTSTTLLLSGDSDTITGIPVAGTGNCNNPALWTDGNYEIAHRVYDQAGNFSGFNGPTQKFVLDTTSPAVPDGLHRVAKDDGEVMACSVMTQRQVLFPTWDANTEADFSHYEYTSYNPGGVIGINEQVLSTNQFIHNWTPPTDGTNGFKVRSVDTAGNKSAWTEICYVTYDSTAPDTPILLSPGNGVPVNGSNPVANDWEDVADSHHYIYQSYNVDGSGNCNLSSIRWTENYNDSQTNSRILGDGLKYCWRVKAVDEAGNESAWSELWKTVVDNTAPSVTLNEIITTSDNTPTLGGSVNDPDADILISIDGAPEVSGTNNGDGTWTYQVTSPLGTGNHTVRVTAVDGAGNTSSPAAEDSFTVNGSVQSFTITPPAQNSAPGNNSQPQGNSSFRSRGNNNAPDESAAVLAAETGTADQPEKRSNFKAADTSNESSFGAPSAESSNGFAWYWWVIIALAMLSALFLLLGRRSEERN